jgi:TPR repeat protein
MPVFNNKYRTRTSRTFLSLLLFSVISICYADDFNDGIKAYQAQNFSLAHEKWLPLAESGHVLAQTLVGSLYVYGEGVERDDTRAAFWFRQAATNGSSQAQYNLGILYEKGWGVEQSNKQARKWFRMAADNGRQDAASRLAMLAELEDAPLQQTAQQGQTTTQTATPLMPFIDIETDIVDNSVATQDDWLRQQPSHYYTMQLAASVQKELLQAHARDLPLDQQYAIVESVRNGKTWYALIYGSYTNSRHARLASNNLPANMRAWQPWIRPFGDIKSWRNLAGLE